MKYSKKLSQPDQYCNCPTCGAEVEPLLKVSGEFGKRLDKAVISKTAFRDREILFKDLRGTPPRLPSRPGLTLLAGFSPVIAALMLSFASRSLTTITEMFAGPAQVDTPIASLTSFSSGLFPYLSGIFALLSVLYAMYQWSADAKYQDYQAWLERIALAIDSLRKKAESYTVCSYCKSIHGPDKQRLDATVEEARKVFVVPQT
jgi:hypothetical protein